ncbi:extracellular solute-binding protein, partial [Planctomycetota bacterium]
MRPKSFIAWLFESPLENLGKGLVLPLVLLAGFVTAIVYTPAQEVTRDDGRVVVTYAEKWSGFEGQAIKDTVDAFNRKQDRIFVELVVQGDIVEKVRIAIAGGNPPDLAGLYSFDVPVFASQNALVPLDDMIEEAGIGPHTYVNAYWRLGVYRDRVWTLPTTPSTWALHWNKKLFREAGLDPERPPRTIQELDEYAEKLTTQDA